MNIFLKAQNDSLSKEEIIDALKKSIEGKKLKKVLIIPPDFTRYYSNAGLITNYYYHALSQNCAVEVMPALGTHQAMTKDECLKMYGDIPYEKFIYHNWREDVEKIGEVPADYVSKITAGLWQKEVILEVNKRIMDPSFDLIISIGQVVPHEVIGMANHSKNIFVGCGGKKIIDASHAIGAFYGMEKMMGKDHTPVRQIFDYGCEHFLNKRPILYVLTVCTNPSNVIKTHGLFIGSDRKVLEEAISLAQEKNITFLEKGIKKCVVYLEPNEFKSTWLANKAIYRTRMVLVDGGSLIILAPGVNKFGEDQEIDRIIRKYGYIGKEKLINLYKDNIDLMGNMGALAHLIHGSSDDRFEITYCVKQIDKDEIKKVNYQALDYDEAIKIYNPNSLKYGYNTLENGEIIYYIPNPALGLWINKEKF